jgi:hypothetical protein
MKSIAIAAFLLIAGCSISSTPRPPVEKIVTVEKQVLVPVTCEEIVEKYDTNFDGVLESEVLEVKVYKLLKGYAQQKLYISRLEEAAAKCGIRITKSTR